MTLHRGAPSGPFPAWAGEPINGVSHPSAIEHLWPADDLRALDLWRDDMIAPAIEPTYGERAVAREVRRVGGVVRYVYVMEDIPLDDLKAGKLVQLASRRWEVETGGVMVGELAVPSDRDTQGRIAQIVAAYDNGFLTGPVLFKFAPGVHADVDEATIRAAMEAGAQLIQTCFRREGELAAEIMAASSIAELQAVDIEAFWP